MKTFELDADSLRKAWGGIDQYWFSLNDYIIKDIIELSDMEKPNDISQSAYYISLGYIPYFSVSNEEIIRAYISDLNDSKLKIALKNIDETNYVESFWKYFNAFPQLHEGWNDYEEKYVLSKAINWCEQNSINYVIK